MNRPKRDETREKRIDMEILVDAYDAEERAMGWYYYLNDTLNFPFKATCVSEKKSSPLKKDERVEVIGMAEVDDCLHDMLVEIEWKDGEETLTVPLSQLEANSVDEQSQELIEDWQYWVARGYGF